MSTRPVHWLIFASVAVPLLALAFFATPSRPTNSSPAAARASAPSKASAADEEPVPSLLSYRFDCTGFAPADPAGDACGPAPAEERALLDAANTYVMPRLPVFTPELTTALAGAEKLDEKSLTPLERAALQNAALTLLSLAQSPSADAHLADIRARARRLVQKFALPSKLVSDLPTAAASLPGWLGDGASWQRGVETRRMHPIADGFARAHQPLHRGETFADVVRLMLVSEKGEPVASDVIQRLTLRSTAADGVHLCVAELDPARARCPNASSLRVISADRQTALIHPTRGATCSGCHPNNEPRAAPFGPDTGFAVEPREVAQLEPTLRRILLR